MGTTYRAVYLVAGRREYLAGDTGLDVATRDVARLKRRGMTAWVETPDGAFVPVPGVQRKPAEIV